MTTTRRAVRPAARACPLPAGKTAAVQPPRAEAKALPAGEPAPGATRNHSPEERARSAGKAESAGWTRAARARAARAQRAERQPPKAVQLVPPKAVHLIPLALRTRAEAQVRLARAVQLSALAPRRRAQLSNSKSIVHERKAAIGHPRAPARPRRAPRIKPNRLAWAPMVVAGTPIRRPVLAPWPPALR